MSVLIVLLIELVPLAVMNMFGLQEHDDMLILPFILILSIALVCYISINKDTQKFKSALICGFIFRLLIMLFALYCRDIYVLPNSGADEDMFYQNAVRVAQGGTTERGFICELMGAFFRFFGISRLWGQFLLMLCSMGALVYACKIMHILQLDFQRASKAIWLLCLLPNFALLSSFFLRESIICMFITMSMYQFLRWARLKKEIGFVLALVFVFCAMRFHSGALAVAVGYILSRLLYDNRTGKLHLSFRNLFLSVIALFAVAYILGRSGDSFLSKFKNLDSLEDIANTRDRGGSSYAQYVGNSNSIANLIFYTIPRVVFFLFSPMPWMIRGIGDVIAFCFSSCFYLITLVSVIKYLRTRKQENRDTVLLVFMIALCAVFVFGWGSSNAGTACRHRDKMVIIWGILYALTLPKKQSDTDVGGVI